VHGVRMTSQLQRATIIGKWDPVRAAVWLVRQTHDDLTGLLKAIDQEQIPYTLIMDEPSFWAGDEVQPPADIVLLDITTGTEAEVEHKIGRWKNTHIPVVAILDTRMVGTMETLAGADDLIVCPWKQGELALRLRRLLHLRAPVGAPGVIIAGDLVIDTNRYDVHIAGHLVVLTFKEYELLKLLVSNAGHVFSREALLEQVWGFHYFGGTRTVDVHIRRLRSKIEDATHTFIDTVWNVGYRFRG
jgi:two-component system alkaline phosphatase synthesis response regulator PhoP